MIEAVMFWNEPNNKSHWAFEIDPEWRTFAEMVKGAARAVRSENPRLLRVLGGISPIDPGFIRNMTGQGVVAEMNVVAVHGFPLDWNHWGIDEWPRQLREIQSVTDLPVWVSEVGVSTFGAEEVQEFGLRRTAELLSGRVDRVHWYSLYDLPRDWPATTRHREAEGSAYYRHFYMGLLREDGTPKRALRLFPRFTPALGICQWFHFEDHRLDDAVKWLRRLGVRHLRTGLSWADSFRPNAIAWFDRQMQALEEFEVTLTFCFTPEHRGIQPHHTSPPQQIGEYAQFCAAMTRRYASGRPGAEPIVSAGSIRTQGQSPDALLEQFCQREPATSLRTVIVAAHPDDEVIGAGAQLPRLRRVTIVHVTDGSPRDLRDAQKAGCATQAEYAELRQREFQLALNVTGVSSGQTRQLFLPDQQAAFHLAGLARELARQFAELQPEIVLTHPYEGGHPDHDATAFAVHQACRLISQQGGRAPAILEMAGYHGASGVMTTGEFLPASHRPVVCLSLAPEERMLKRLLFACYQSQRAVLQFFSPDREQFRVAPDYDFTRPPHSGRLYYESQDWGMTFSKWRTLVGDALRELRPAPVAANGSSHGSVDSTEGDLVCGSRS